MTLLDRPTVHLSFQRNEKLLKIGKCQINFVSELKLEKKEEKENSKQMFTFMKGVIFVQITKRLK